MWAGSGVAGRRAADEIRAGTQERRPGLRMAAEADEPGTAARGLAPGRRGLRGARGGPSARGAAHRTGRLGAAHAEGAGADEPAAYRGAHRRDGHDRAGDRAGDCDPKVLARHRNGRVKASAADIERALTGNWREEHLFVLRQALAIVGSLAHRRLAV